MVQEKKLQKKEYEELVQEKITLNIRSSIDLYPDYVTYVHQELKELVATNEGLKPKLESNNQATREKAEQQLNQKVTQLLNSGVTIHTALNPRVANSFPKSAEYGDCLYRYEGASVVIQHHTHELVSLIGGKNYKKNSFNRAYQSYRQPGSAIKPLLVYAPYIEETGCRAITHKLAVQATVKMAIVQKTMVEQATAWFH